METRFQMHRPHKASLEVTKVDFDVHKLRLTKSHLAAIKYTTRKCGSMFKYADKASMSIRYPRKRYCVLTKMHVTTPLTVFRYIRFLLNGSTDTLHCEFELGYQPEAAFSVLPSRCMHVLQFGIAIPYGSTAYCKV